MTNTTNAIHITRHLSIPLSEISFRFSHSSGPGGQHVNKAETRVTLLFDARQSPALSALLSEQAHERLLERLSSRLDSEGILQVSAQESRSQHKNRQMAVARFQTILSEALKEPKRRRKSRPSRAAEERRLEKKKRRGQLKQERSRKWDDRIP